MKKELYKNLKFIVLLMFFSLNVSSVFSHGYHPEEEINQEQRQDFIDEHTHN
jgi:hypothetical protein